MQEPKDTRTLEGVDPSPERSGKPCVFVHTNHKQWIAALVSQYSLKRYSAHGDAFDVRIIHTKDFPFLHAREGQLHLRDGLKRTWLMDDLQSFAPLRFTPPELMNYSGRAIVIDPDVFAVGDVYELLARDMQGKAIMCRLRPGAKAFETIGLFEEEWNDFDRLTDKTKLLHNTKRKTQPWKTGLKIDYAPNASKNRGFRPVGWLRRARESVFGRYGMLGHYKSHPDPNQERYFFGLLRECLEKGVISEALLRDEMEHDHIRHDAFEVAERSALLATPGDRDYPLSKPP
jgi:hypothetical protein